MRVLIVSYAEITHYFHMAPLAWALRTAGHEVRVASQPELAKTIVESGLPAVSLGTDHKFLEVMKEKNDPTWSERTFNIITDPSQFGRDEYHAFLDEYMRDCLSVVNNDELVDDLVAYACEWQPDLIVWEQLSWAGAVAAKVSGAAHARLLHSADLITRLRQGYLRQLPEPAGAADEPIAAWVARTLARHGCSFDEEALTGQWTIDTAPASHRADLGLRTLPMRYVPYNGPAAIPDWLRQPPQRPRVCITSGICIRNYFGVDALPIAALQALADLDVEIVATLVPGPGESVADAPPNARVVDFVPMLALLPTCSAVMHHGGAGIQATAIHYGVPQLITPGMTDTALRARPLAEAGAGLTIMPHEMSPERVRGDLTRLLTEPGFQVAAERLRQEAVSAPSPNDVVADLVRLAEEHAARGDQQQPQLVGV